MFIGPPIELSQVPHTLKHTCNIEAGGNGDTYSSVHIFSMALGILFSVFFLS